MTTEAEGLWRVIQLQIPTTIDECENGNIDLGNNNEAEAANIDESFATAPWLLQIKDENRAANKLERTNKFLQNLCATQAFQENGARIDWILFKSITLDHWEPLLNTLQQSGAYIKKLELNGCDLTERASLVLGNVLKTTDAAAGGLAPSNNDNQTTATTESIHIEEFRLTLPDGSPTWIDGFFENKTLISLDFCGLPGLLKIAMKYIQNAPQLKRAKFFMSPIRFRFGRREEEEEEEEFLESNDVALNLRTFEIIFGPGVPLSLCQSIGSILRRTKTKLRTLIFVFWNIQRAHRERFLDAICHEIANNKGPEILKIEVGAADLGDFVPRLATSLVRKNDIKKLEISARTAGDDSADAQRELVNAMGTMPQLRSWKVLVRSPLSPQMIETWKQWILCQLESNWNIRETLPPFDIGVEIQDLLVFNRRFRKMISNQDKLSSGIWSSALSKSTTVGLTYRVVCQIPSLFQQVASEQETDQIPSFTVPHNPDCPGCCKERGKK